MYTELPLSSSHDDYLPIIPAEPRQITGPRSRGCNGGFLARRGYRDAVSITRRRPRFLPGTRCPRVVRKLENISLRQKGSAQCMQVHLLHRDFSRKLLTTVTFDLSRMCALPRPSTGPASGIKYPVITYLAGVYLAVIYLSRYTWHPINW